MKGTVRMMISNLQSLPSELSFNDTTVSSTLDEASLLNSFFIQCINRAIVAATYSLPENIDVPQAFTCKDEDIKIYLSSVHPNVS